MSPNDQVSALYKNHQKWINFAQAFLSVANMMHAEDIVQEAYLRILKDLHKNPNKVIGKAYMYHTIKSISIDDGRKKTDPLKYSRGLEYFPEITSEGNNKKKEDISEKITAFVNTTYWFDKEIFQLYRYEIRSIRQISKATKIGHKQIFNSIKRTKQKINSALKKYYYEK